MTSSVDYDAFGGFLGGVPVDRYAFTGREWDSDIGLQYNRARMYSPDSGRWMSEDPIGFAAGDANLQRFVGNGPTNGNDPSGKDWTADGVKAQLALADPLVYTWFIQSGAQLAQTNWYSFNHYGWNGNSPSMTFRSTFSDDDVVAAILNDVSSTWFSTYSQDYIRWLKGFVQDEASAGRPFEELQKVMFPNGICWHYYHCLGLRFKKVPARYI